MKIAILCLTSLLTFLPLASNAALDSEASLKVLAGKYQVSGDQNFQFLIRSAGNVEILGNNLPGATSSSLTWINSNGGDLINGLPVAHIVIAIGSDEDVVDYHILLAIVQSGNSLTVKKLSAFTTFNDGPNEISDVDLGQFGVKKYNKNSHRMEDL